MILPAVLASVVIWVKRMLERPARGKVIAPSVVVLCVALGIAWIQPMIFRTSEQLGVWCYRDRLWEQMYSQMEQYPTYLGYQKLQSDAFFHYGSQVHSPPSPSAYCLLIVYSLLIETVPGIVGPSRGHPKRTGISPKCCSPISIAPESPFASRQYLSKAGFRKPMALHHGNFGF